jgi:hypothetical protein
VAFPPLAVAASASQLLPIVTARIVWGRQVPAPYLRLLAYCVFIFLADLQDIVIGSLRGDNWFTAYYNLPLEVVLTLWLLLPWQAGPRMRRAYRTAMGLVAAGAALALVPADRARVFHQLAEPALDMVALMAILQTLVERTLRSRGPLPGEDWFWICIGLALVWILAVPVMPFAVAYVRSQSDWVLYTLLSKDVFFILALVFIAWGVACRRVRAPSLSPS